mgnify:CR=1 FL=1
MYINKFQVVNGRYVQQTKPTQKLYCKDCQHYIKNGEVCRMFTSVDFVSGVEKSVKAIDARKNIDMCGNNATVFQEKDSKYMLDYNDNDNDAKL